MSPRLLLVPLALALALALAGCPEVDCARQAESTPSLELGTGSSSFQPILDGDVLSAAWGAQGGNHVWLSMRTQGILNGYPEPGLPGLGAGLRDAPTAEIALERPDGLLLVEQSLSPYLDNDEAVGITAVLQYEFSESWGDEGEAETDPTELLEETERMDLLLTAEVTDVCGVTVSDERIIRLRFPWIEQQPTDR